MKPRSNATAGHARAFVPLLVAAVGGSAGLGVLLLMLSNAQMLVGFGLIAHAWYVLLLLLGVAAAVTVFSIFKSYARYTGKVWGGTVQLGGPVVIMLLVIVLGFYLVPAPAQFEVTVFLHGDAGHRALVLRNRGKVSLDLGPDKRIESVGSKGEVRFVGIPANMRGRQVAVALDDDKYELVNSGLEIQLDRDVFYAAIRPRGLRLAGYVSDSRGRPVARARAHIAGNATMTDEDGRFEIVLPADISEGDRSITITAPGYEPWHAQAVPGGNALQVSLSPSSDGK